jgi:hypothetical protein
VKLWEVFMLNVVAMSLLAVAFAVGGASAAELRAGAARVDLTPSMELHSSLGGYGARMNRPATGVHDRVWVKALALFEGDRRFVIVTADILGFPPGVKSAVAERLASEGWSADQILLLPSHSHTSIDMSVINPRNDLGIPQIGIFSRPIFDWTVDRLTKVIQEAAKSPEPVSVGTTDRMLTGWIHNRRAGNSATDPDLIVTRVDRADGRPLAVLVNFATHPTFMDENDMMFSGDWPGYLQRTLESLIGDGVTAMFYNGAEGDQAPSARPESGESHWEKAMRYGIDLGVTAWSVWKTIKPKPGQPLAYHSEEVSLPKRTYHPDFMRTGGAEYGLSPESIEGIIEHTVPVGSHNNCVRLGDLVIVGVPGEMASALGQEVKARVRKALGVKQVAIGGLADEWISYILSEGEYRKGGGYEASVSFYGPTLGPTMVESAVRCAGKLK